MELRYVGNRTISFLNPPVGEVHPGDTFHVELDDPAAADGLLARADVEEVTDDPPEDTGDDLAAESPQDGGEVAEDPTERQDGTKKTTPSAPARKRAAAKTDTDR